MASPIAPLAPVAAAAGTARPLGLGTAPLGNLFTGVPEEDAAAAIGTAWDLGIRSFDTAPLYGYGESERRLGRALRDRPRDEYTISTKVGRLIREGAPPSPEQLHDGEHFYKTSGRANPVFDYGYDGVMRSLEESLERLGLDRVDLLYIHDPDDHYAEAVEGAYRALDSLREQGVVRAIGVGMNQSGMLADFARDARFDYFLLAGRYTLLDQGALDELLPLCLENGIGINAGGVLNSGILADPSPGATFDYVPASAERLRQARAVAEVCARHDVPLIAAALQFPTAHPAIGSILVGARNEREVRDNDRLLSHPIPAQLWEDLRERRLIAPGAPVPG
ncbi:aldo/keto reductase [Streptosporangium sp. NPDC050855]|uniref:aldo/keto reductase n=1 Tax=Streptosporangium sp. NPDC050855 TaxID=3366194 RepID=UPI0037BBF100